MMDDYDIQPQGIATPSTLAGQDILVFGDTEGIEAADFSNCKVLGRVCDESTRFDGPVFAVSDAAQKFPQATVVVCTTETAEKSPTLPSNSERATGAGLTMHFNRVCYYRPTWPDISETLALLDDDVSRTVLAQQDRMLRNGVHFENFSSVAGSHYAHPHVGVAKGDNIISIGTFYGMPLRLFFNQTGRDCRVHCFEANANIYAQLCKNIVAWDMSERVVPVCAAIWSKTGMYAFDSQGGVGGGNVIDPSTGKHPVRETVDLAIYAYSIDDYVKQTGFIPTLIENGRIGITPQVLDGARDTIAKHKPKLILLDFVHSDSVKMLKELVPEYRVFYSESGRWKYGVYFATV